MDVADGVDRERFRNTMGRFLSGVTVVSAHDREHGTAHGATVSAFLSVSLDPPLILVSLGLATRILKLVRTEGRFAVNILGEHQESLALHFARRHSLDRPPLFQERHGVPYLPGSLATVVAHLTDVHEAGDHALVVARATSVFGEEGWPLAYFRSRFYRLVPPEVLDRLLAYDL